MKNRLDNSPLFIVLYIATLLSYLFATLAFIVSKWYSMYPGSMSDFQNIGLWEVCFSSYMNEEIYDKLYSDCFYIMSSEVSDLYQWMVQNWFLACQVIYSISFTSLMVASVVGTLMCFGLINLRYWRNAVIMTVLHCIAWVTCFATLIIFGVNTKDLTNTKWMPNPTQCSLSWSYGSAALSLLATMISLGLLFFVLRSHTNNYVNWCCGKNLQYHNQLENMGEMEFSTPQVVSIYDPRGTNTESRISADRSRSLMSSRLEPSHNQTTKKTNHPSGSMISGQSQSRSEKSKTVKSVPQESHVPKISKPDHYSKKSTKAFPSENDAGYEQAPPHEIARKYVKVVSPAGSQLTVTSKNASSTVIAAKPMRRN